MTLAMRRAQLGQRVLSRASGLDAQSAAALRDVAVRLLNNEHVDAAELAQAFPASRGGGPQLAMGVSVGPGGELSLQNAYAKAGRVAIIDLCGPIYFNAGFWEVAILNAIPTGMLVAAIDQAAQDSSIDTLLVDADCPGGSVAGMFDLVAAANRLKSAGKQLLFLAHDRIQSGAMWLAALADRIYTTPTGDLGSVGVLMLLYDDSVSYREQGVVPKPIATDPRKAVGYPGVPITDENTADLRRSVQLTYEAFVTQVAQGRGLDPEEIRAMGAQNFTGADAVAAGLADEVVPDVDALIRELAGQ